MKTTSEQNGLRESPGAGELRAGSRREGEHKWRRLFLAVLVVVLLHLPFLLLKPGSEEPAPVQPQRRLAAIAQPEAARTPSEKALWRWIEFSDPSQWYFPTAQGFSRYNVFAALPGPELPHFTLSPAPLPEVPLAESRLEGNLPPVDERGFLALKSVSLPEPVLPERGELPFPAPRWRILGGGVLANPPEFPEEVWKLRQESWKKKELSGLIPTVMEVEFLPGLSVPRLLLRSSCGVPALDRAALDALRGFLRRKAGPALWQGAPAARFQLLVEWVF